MTARLLLWLWGSLTIASLIMIVGWSRPTRDFWRLDVGSRRWSRRLALASSLLIHAIAMSVACAYRVIDLLHGTLAPFGSEPTLLVISITMLLASNVGLVWASAIDPVRRRVRKVWWAFLYAMLLWGIFCSVWMGGWM